MRTLTAISIFLFLASSGSAIAADMRSLGFLSEIAPSGLEYHVTKKLKTVKYCPDNTCNILEAPASIPNAVFNDFAFLFLSYASGYIYLKEPFDNSRPFLETSKKFLPQVVERRKHHCNGDEFEIASCILNKMAKEYSIKIYFSRFDEGENIKELEKQEEVLSVKVLRSTRSWLMEQ